MTHPLAALALLFGHLSLLAIGGVNATIPEMQRQVVDLRHWMNARDFVSLFALAQAAPGPNMLVASLVGWRVAGPAGAAVATAAICGPTCVLTYAVAGVWHRFREASWRQVVQAGLTPVTVGLILAASVDLAETTSARPPTALVTLVVASAALRSRRNPLIWLACAAALGATGWLGA